MNQLHFNLFLIHRFFEIHSSAVVDREDNIPSPFLHLPTQRKGESSNSKLLVVHNHSHSNSGSSHLHFHSDFDDDFDDDDLHFVHDSEETRYILV